MLTVLDIFSGIGGFSLGLERTGGFKTVAFCEIDPFCRKVLRKHWPDVPIHEDVTKLRGEDVGPVDVIAGGFPCQDISTAGRGEGIEGSRSGLWKEFARLIGELRPRYVIVENVAALLGRGLDRVLGDLAEIGFDAEWHCIPASAVGAPHRRDRVWIVAQPARTRPSSEPQSALFGRLSGRSGKCGADVAYPESERRREAREHSERSEEWTASGGIVANPDCTGQPDIQGCRSDAWRNGDGAVGSGCWPDGGDASNADFQPLVWSPESWGQCGQWSSEPDVGRVAHGVPAGLHGDLDGNEMDGSKTGAKSYAFAEGQNMRRMQQQHGPAASSSGLQQAKSVPDSLQAMSCEGGSEGRPPPDQAAKELCGLRSEVHAEPQQEAQDVRPRLSIRIGQAECDEAMEQWVVEPDIPRVAVGVPQRVNRLRSLGNAVVPQVVETIGNAILESD